jgi:hypothetical protein
MAINAIPIALPIRFSTERIDGDFIQDAPPREGAVLL